MEKPQLLLLTNSYPFEGGEPFLDAEIKHLKKYFEVDILPCGLKYSAGSEYQAADFNILQNLALEIKRRKYNLLFLLRSFWLTRANIFREFKENIAYSSAPKGFARLCWRALRARIVLDVILKNEPLKRYDVVYSYWMSYEGLVAKWLGEVVGYGPTIITRAHGHDLYHYANTPPYCPFQKEIARSADFIVLISQHGLDYLKRRYPDITGDKCVLFPLGVPGGKRSPKNEDNRLKLVSCSAVRPVKRVSLILDALELTEIPVDWTHIGDGPEMTLLKKKAQKIVFNKKNVRITFLGKIPNRDVLEYYEQNAVDLFINVSKSEGLPVSIMEAYSRGIPAIATDVGGNSEIVGPDAGSGWLLGSDPKPEDIAEILRSCWKNKAILQEESNKAYCVWKELFDADRNHSKFAFWMFKKSANNSRKNGATPRKLDQDLR